MAENLLQIVKFCLAYLNANELIFFEFTNFFLFFLDLKVKNIITVCYLSY